MQNNFTTPVLSTSGLIADQGILSKISSWLSESSQDVRFWLKPKYSPTGELIDFVFTRVNEATCIIMGKPKNAIYHQEFLKVLGIEASHSFYQKYLRVHKTSEPFIEMFPSPLGDKRWISHMIIKMQDEMSIVINFLNLEKVSSVLYNAKEHTSNELVQKVSTSGKILEMNQVSALYFDKGQLIQPGLWMNNILHPVSKLAYEMAVQRVKHHRVEMSLPVTFITKDKYYLRTKGVLVPYYVNQKLQSINQSFQIEGVTSSLDNRANAQGARPAYSFF
jgi:hypothetical protein